ncbi:putative zinc-type alcohol dehydrogenase-like protein YdjJ [Sporomusa silvacetica DSM 10669]|uniref:Zinc-type alcohol dehydrogenase-like protein YdjJ n=1 Tax=Sporomusa silvacetica DSM 10669 TaxID=1123289 RepID=A0ABZ3ILD6_9FIRM|nr:zinc-binding dehydrogenase [Sporomusa silvacetica]OZC13456.1 sorbitol dehydrogenase [Sporomusa silvacetica DSM 10669]
MKVVVLEGTHKLAVGTAETPKPDGYHVLIQIDKTGICGSETHFWYDIGDSMKGTVLGHEYCGTVLDPGANKDLKVGDRVTSEAMGCGKCDLCRAGHQNVCFDTPLLMGGFGEVAICVPDAAVKVPDNVSSIEAAMVEPIATSLHAVNRANIKIGDKVCIIGGGIIGLGVASFAKMNGASKVVLVEANMEKAKKILAMGDVDAIFDALDENCVEKLKEYTGGPGFDVAFECSGAGPAVATAIKVVKRATKVMLVGGSPADTNGIPLSHALLGEVNLITVYAYSRDEFLRVMEAMGEGRINAEKYATKIVTLDEVPQVFEDLRNRRIDDVKVIIDVAKK